MMDGIQPTIPIGGNEAFGGGSGIWLFAILALMWGGNGFFGGRGCGGNCATTEDLAVQSNFTRLEAQNNALSASITNLANGICDLGYKLAQDTACINATTVTQTQKILDKLCEQENARLREKVTELSMSNQTATIISALKPAATTGA
jgi:hypothetical protein